MSWSESSYWAGAGSDLEGSGSQARRWCLGVRPALVVVAVGLAGLAGCSALAGQHVGTFGVSAGVMGAGKMLRASEVQAAETVASAAMPVVPTTSGKSATSFFCYAWMLIGSVEVELLRAQASHGASIFACDEWSVFSSEPTWVVDEDQNDTVVIRHPPKVVVHCTGNPVEPCWAANSRLFHTIANHIADSRIWERHDFTIKVDADTVWIPDRLKTHLDAYGPQGAVWYMNTPLAMMAGPIEILSRGAWEVFSRNVSRCTDVERSEPAEDYWLGDCMQLLGVREVPDYTILADRYSYQALGGCKAGAGIAFHPLKTTRSYLACLHNATGSGP